MTTKVQLEGWEPGYRLASRHAEEVALSRGFLRCDPRGWFPSFSLQWAPLFHALGVQVTVERVTPSLQVPEGEISFEARYGDEPLIVSTTAATADALERALLNETLRQPVARSVVLEYLARRCIGSLALSWAGPGEERLSFVGACAPFSVPCAGRFQISCQVNGVPISFSVGVGHALAGRLDWLWRRQLHNAARGEGDTVAVEIAELAVPPSQLSEYTAPGAIVDLETVAKDRVTLRRGEKIWCRGELVRIGSVFGVQMSLAPETPPLFPAGMTRLGVLIGEATLDATLLAELYQDGAILSLEIPVQDEVKLRLNGQNVARARLGLLEGRFAYQVLGPA